MRKTSLSAFLLLAAATGAPAFGRDLPPVEPSYDTEMDDIRMPKNTDPKEAKRENEYLRDTGEVKVHFFPSAYGGYNQLLAGYPGYENLGNFGAELWIYPVKFNVDEPKWHTNNFLFRVSGDYMPLQVPKTTYGLTEDLYAATFQILYKFDRAHDGGGFLFFGLGAGSYLDRLTLDTPASGRVTGQYSYFGFNGALGMVSPAVGPFRLVPEARYHRVRVPDGYWAQNITYQVGLMYGFSDKYK